MFSWEHRQWLPYVSYNKNVWKKTCLQTDRLAPWAADSCCRQELVATSHDDSKLSVLVPTDCVSHSFVPANIYLHLAQASGERWLLSALELFYHSHSDKAKLICDDSDGSHTWDMLGDGHTTRDAL